MAIPYTENPNSIYSQGQRLAENGSPVTDAIDKGVSGVKDVVTSGGSVIKWLTNNWQIAILGAVALLLLLRR